LSVGGELKQEPGYSSQPVEKKGRSVAAASFQATRTLVQTGDEMETENVFMLEHVEYVALQRKRISY